MSIKPRIIPFRVGGPIQDPTEFVGRETVLQAIASAMLRLQNVSLHGERRTGKTSLLLYLAHPASDIGLPERHIPVYFSFQDIAAEATAASVWQAIADAIAGEIKQRYPDRQADSERFLATVEEFLAPSKGPKFFGTGFGRALAHLDSSGFKIHLLFDEFEQTARSPNLRDPFYDTLRGLPIRAENISYVIATRTGLVSLQPTYDKVSSPFFNIFTTIVLAPFHEDEVRRLIVDYFARAELGSSLAKKLCDEFPFLYDMTGYHPFFLQALCYHLWARLDEPDWPLGLARQEAIRAYEKDSEPHFQYYWELSSRAEQELLEKLAAGQSIEWDPIGHIAERLKDRCLIVPADSGWQLFSSAFARWIQGQLIAAWYEEGMAHVTAGNLKQAKASFERVRERQPDYPDVADRLEEVEANLHLEYLLERAFGQEESGEWESVIEVCREILSIDPMNREASRCLERAQKRADQGEEPGGLAEIAVRVQDWWDERDRRAKAGWMVLFAVVVLSLCVGAAVAPGVFPAVLVSTSTPTPTSTFIATPTTHAAKVTSTPANTPTPTLAPSNTPTSSPTPRPTATSTPTVTATPTRRPGTPMPTTPAVLSAPVLLAPENGVHVSGNLVFSWTWYRGIDSANGEHFALRVWHEGAEPRSITWTEGTSYEVEFGEHGLGPSGRYFWNVVVVRQTGEPRSENWELVSRESETRWFTVEPPKPTPTPRKPKPNPTSPKPP